MGRAAKRLCPENSRLKGKFQKNVHDEVLLKLKIPCALGRIHNKPRIIFDLALIFSGKNVSGLNAKFPVLD
jgi:hypothetical protein